MAEFHLARAGDGPDCKERLICWHREWGGGQDLAQCLRDPGHICAPPPLLIPMRARGPTAEHSSAAQTQSLRESSIQCPQHVYKKDKGAACCLVGWGKIFSDLFPILDFFFFAHQRHMLFFFFQACFIFFLIKAHSYGWK